jgi:hypothetical protein
MIDTTPDRPLTALDFPGHPFRSPFASVAEKMFHMLDDQGAGHGDYEVPD